MVTACLEKSGHSGASGTTASSTVPPRSPTVMRLPSRQPKGCRGRLPGKGALVCTTNTAHDGHRAIVAVRRRTRTAKAKESHKVEYVYNYWDWSDCDYPGESRIPVADAYQIHKTTRLR